MGLPSNLCILSSRFLLPSNSCLPRDSGGTSWGWHFLVSYWGGDGPWNLLLPESLILPPSGFGGCEHSLAVLFPPSAECCELLPVSAPLSLSIPPQRGPQGPSELTNNVLISVVTTPSSSPHRGSETPMSALTPWVGGLPAGGEWGPRQLRPHEEGRKMPAELLLLLIVAFASPSCQVLSSLRMGEALQPPAPASSQTLSPGPGAFLGACSSLGTQESGPQPSSPQLLPTPWTQEFRPLVLLSSPPSEPGIPGAQPLLPQDPGVWSPTPVSPQLPSWMTRQCVAVANVWPWPWPGSRSTGSSRSQPRPAWK